MDKFVTRKYSCFSIPLYPLHPPKKIIVTYVISKGKSSNNLSNNNILEH